MTRRFGAVVLLALGVACDGPTEPSVGLVQERIVGGAPSASSHDAVVLVSRDASFACTGTLIASNLVLTARHCVSVVDERGDCGLATREYPASTITISVGKDASSGTGVAMGKRVIAPASSDLCGADVALLLLARRITGAVIAPLRFTTALVGEDGVAVGYGDDGNGAMTPGRFERAAVKVIAVGPVAMTYEPSAGPSLPLFVPAGEFATSESTCTGDSGGPLLDGDGRVIGVASRGIDEACFDRPTLWIGLEAHEKWIADAVVNAALAVDDPLPDVSDGGLDAAPDAPLVVTSLRSGGSGCAMPREHGGARIAWEAVLVAGAALGRRRLASRRAHSK